MFTPFDSRVTSAPANGPRAVQTDVAHLFWRISQHLSRERRTKNQNLVRILEFSFRFSGNIHAYRCNTNIHALSNAGNVYKAVGMRP